MNRIQKQQILQFRELQPQVFERVQGWLSDMIIAPNGAERMVVDRWRKLEFDSVKFTQCDKPTLFKIITLSNMRKQVVDLISILLENEDKDVLLIRYL